MSKQQLEIITRRFVVIDSKEVLLDQSTTLYIPQNGWLPVEQAQFSKAAASAVTAESLGVSQKSFRCMKRMHEIDKLRASGLGCTEISRKLGISTSSVWAMYNRKFHYSKALPPAKLAAVLNP